MKNIFLFTYDSIRYYWMSEDVHNFLNEISLNWWHYQMGVYLIIMKEKKSKDIADKIIKKFPNFSFLITKIELDDYNGLMPERSWKWIARIKKHDLKFDKGGEYVSSKN